RELHDAARQSDDPEPLPAGALCARGRAGESTGRTRNADWPRAIRPEHGGRACGWEREMSNIPNDIPGESGNVPHDDMRGATAQQRAREGGAAGQDAVRTNPNSDPDMDSPFGSGASSGRRRVMGAAIFAVVLLATIGAVYQLTGDEGGAAAADMAGHNHGAAPAADSAMPVMLTEEDARRIGVTYAPVTLGPLMTEIRTVAQVTFDETRVKAIASKIDGWVEELYVNYTGQPVQQGQALLSIYSPMLVSAQQELLLARQLMADVAGGTPEAQSGARELSESA